MRLLISVLVVLSLSLGAACYYWYSTSSANSKVDGDVVPRVDAVSSGNE